MQEIPWCYAFRFTYCVHFRSSWVMNYFTLRLECESLPCDECRSTYYVVSMGWCLSPSFTLPVMVGNAWLWHHNLAQNDRLPSLRRIYRRQFTVAVHQFDPHIPLVELLQGRCSVPDLGPHEEGEAPVITVPIETHSFMLMGFGAPAVFWAANCSFFSDVWWSDSNFLELAFVAWSSPDVFMNSSSRFNLLLRLTVLMFNLRHGWSFSIEI